MSDYVPTKDELELLQHLVRDGNIPCFDSHLTPWFGEQWGKICEPSEVQLYSLWNNCGNPIGFRSSTTYCRTIVDEIFRQSTCTIFSWCISRRIGRIVFFDISSSIAPRCSSKFTKNT